MSAERIVITKGIFSSRALIAMMVALMLTRAAPTARESTQKNPKYKQDNGLIAEGNAFQILRGMVRL